jgi:hypothetical protein
METLMFKPRVCAVMAAALLTGTGARAAESPADRDSRSASTCII